MRFIQVTAENFLSYRRLDLDLTSRGLLLILGQNQDESAASSNGSGKTAVIDAFTYALWGLTLRGLSGDEIVNRRIGKDCWVNVLFVDDDGVKYEVSRYRRHRKYQNELHFASGTGGQDGDLTGSSVADTQKKLNSILGLDFETATQSLILGQGAIVHFADATDADRKHVLDLILGLQSLEKCLEQTRKQKRDIEKNIATDTRECELHENQIRRVAEEVMQLKDRVANFETKRQNKVSELQHKLDEINAESDRMIEEQEQFILGKKTEIERFEAQAQSITMQLAKRDAVRQSILQKNDEEVQKRSELSTLELQIKAEQERLDYLEGTEGANCPLCEKPLSEQEKTKLTEQIQVTISDIRQQLSSGSVELQSLRDIRKQLADREEELKRIEGQLMKVNMQKQQCLADIEKAQRSDERRSTMSVRYREIQMQLIQAREERPEYEDLLYKKQDEGTELSARLKSLQDRNEENKRLLPYLVFWERGFSNQGLKSFILDNITPLLEQSANRFGRIMMGDEFRIVVTTQSTLKSGEAREKLDIQVLNGLGDNIFVGASAGEKQRVNLCLALALQELIASRHKRALGIAFFDEVTTNLDTEGLERFIDLLKQELGHKESIFVISHNPELSMYFDNMVTVEKKNGESKLIESK